MATSRVGIRELREKLSVAIRRVRGGETIEVTDRGRPVARIVPIERSAPGLEQLVNEGKVYAPRARLPLPNPLDLPSVMSSSEAIDILRSE